MAIEKFENILAWQKAKDLNVKLYAICIGLKDLSFKDQLLRASVSIMNNIAEGFERKGHKEFSRFLYIAKGSSGEVRSMLYLGAELDYISEDKFREFYNQSVEISKLLAGLIKSL